MRTKEFRCTKKVTLSKQSDGMHASIKKACHLCTLSCAFRIFLENTVKKMAKVSSCERKLPRGLVRKRKQRKMRNRKYSVQIIL